MDRNCNPLLRVVSWREFNALQREGKAVIAAGAGTGISAKFIEKGGADLIIIYNSGRFRMAGHGSRLPRAFRWALMQTPMLMMKS